jgi:hypothetical protein
MPQDSDDTRQAHTSEDVSLPASVARDMSQIARDLEASSDTQSVMNRIVRAAVDEIPGCTRAAITLVSRGKVSSAAHSDDVAGRVGTAQEETGEGPCVDTPLAKR